MASKIYLVRHAESVHNVSKDFSQLDPGLTPLGFEQAEGLIKSFPHASEVNIILTSPLRRAIQTALAAFPHVLDKRYFSSHSNQGIENGAILIIDPDLQERSALPCDTGSARESLEAAFAGIDFKCLVDEWQLKDGLYSPDDEAVNERARRMRFRLAGLSKNLKNKERKHIVAVTHGAFMKFLSQEPEIDLQKAGWKSYTIEGQGSDVVLVPDHVEH